MATQDIAPPVSHMLETILYVRDMKKSREFYKDVFGIEPMGASDRGTSFGLGKTVFLLFQIGLTCEDLHEENEGTIPWHGPTKEIRDMLMQQPASNGERAHLLKQHFCFAVEEREDVERYEARFKQKGIKILGTMNWERGGYSVYFEDPDGHVGEVGSRGMWRVY